MTDHRDLDLAESGSMGFPTGDPELITRVRGGDRQAFAELYRRHVGAATNLARQIIPGAGADDLVSEAFARVLDGLLLGKGPDAAFRAYVFTTVRNTANDRFRRDRRVTFTDDQTTIDSAVSDPDIVMLQAENGMVGQAYQSLPERWQAVLWYLSVEGYSPAKTGELLGLSANAVTSLAFRAREGLREAYLQAHLLKTEAEQCSSVVGKLGAWTRDGLSRRERTAVDTHLDSCPDCRALAFELGQINSGMRALLAPLLLGGAALAYLKLVGPATAIAKIGIIGVGTTTGTGAAASTGAAGTTVGAGAAGTGGATGSAGTATAGTTAAGTTAGTTAAGTTAAGTTAAGTTVGATAASTAAGTTAVGTGVVGTGVVGTGVIGTSVVGTGVLGSGVGVGAGVAAGGIAAGTGVGLVSAGGIGAGLVSAGGISAGLAAVGITAGFGGLGTLLVTLPKTVLAVAGSTIGGAAVAGAMLTGTSAQPVAPDVAAPAPVVVASTARTPAFPVTSDGTVVIRTSAATRTTGPAAQSTMELLPLPILDTTVTAPVVPVPTETTTESASGTDGNPGAPVDPTGTPDAPADPTTQTDTTSAAPITEPAPPVDPPPAPTTDTPTVPTTPTTDPTTPTTEPTTTEPTTTEPTTTEPTTTEPTTTEPTTTEPTTTEPTTTEPTTVLVALPSFTGAAALTSDLGTGTFTLVQQIGNIGTGALTDGTLTADSGLLTSLYISVVVTSSAGTEGAVTPAADCTAAGCALPTIPAGSTASITLTLQSGTGVTLDQLQDGLLALQVTAGSRTDTSSVPLAPSIPTVSVRSVGAPITAGLSGALDVEITAPAGSALPSSVGIVVDDRLRLTGDGCSTVPASGSLQCPVTATDTGAQVQIAVAALPDARTTTTAEITVGRFTTSRDISVRPRTSQISLTGPFQVSSTAAALGRTCVGAAPAGASAPTACATDVPATATILWAEVVWTWAADPASAESGVTLFSGADAASGTPLALGTPSGVTTFGSQTGDDAGYRSAPIRLDAAAQAALTGGNGSQLGFSGPEGAVGGWTVVMLWTDDSVTSPATVQVDDAVQIVRAGQSVTQDAGTISTLLDLDATSSNLSRWLYSWYDEQGTLQGTLVQLLTGARLFPGGTGGTFSTGAGAPHGLLYGPVITPR